MITLHTDSGQSFKLRVKIDEFEQRLAEVLRAPNQVFIKFPTADGRKQVIVGVDHISVVES